MAIPETDARFVTLAALSEYLKMPTTGPANDLLNDKLDAALAYVATRVGPLDVAQRTYRAYPTPSGRLCLSADRLAAVVEVRDPDGAVVVPVDVDLEAGIVNVGRVWSRTRAWEVDATREAFAADVSEAVKIIASHLYELHRGRDARPGFTPSADDSTPPPSGFAIPRRASELLGPHLLVAAG